MKKHAQLKIYFLLVSTLFCGGQQAFADFRLAKLFGDNMVMQRNVDIPVWGWGDKKERITVIFNGQEFKAKPDKKTGKWMVTLPALKEGGPYKMQVKGREKTIEIANILIGEVWICSGQSNMEWSVENTNNAEEEIANSSNPNIRHFNVARRVSNVPLDELEEGTWEIASPETVASFTAVGYFFAKELQKAVDVPIGLINTTWGGTIVETWISAGAINTIEEYAPVVNDLQVLNVEEMLVKKRQELAEKLGGEVPTKDEGYINGKGLWAAKEFDRSAWQKMKVPALWENQGLPGLDGIIWFNKTLELTAEEAAQGGTLHLSMIDDEDITWINGEQVGETKGYSKPRAYKVKADLLKEGENVIVVRVVDTGGGGGIYGKKNQVYFQVGDEQKSLAGEWSYKVAKADVKPLVLKPNSMPTLLYNGMVHALIPYPFKGAIWYQGESNAGFAYQYRETFPMLINNWRSLWGQGDFPFLWVQLANFREPVDVPSGSDWAELREAQTKTLSLPNTGEAVIIDIGEADDIHPRNKQDVGLRLSLAARKVAYGEDLTYASPRFESMKVEGDKVRVKFSNVGDGLIAKDKYGYVNGFAVAGKDQKFHWAQAEIVSDNEVLLSCDDVSNPVAVRYGWANNPDDVNLYNSADLPATPFRTDTWEGVTEGLMRSF